MNELPLSKFGLLTVAEAAERRGVSDETIRVWVSKGLAVVVVGEGRNRKHLIPTAELDRYAPAPKGRPAGKTPKPSGKPRRGRK